MPTSYRFAVLPFAAILIFSSCTKKENAETPPATTENPSPAAQSAPASEPGPRAFIHLKDGSKVPGTIVASSRTDMVLAGDDGIERKIPVGQIKSVEYADATSGAFAPTPSKEAARPKTLAKAQPGAVPSVPVQ